MQNRSPVEAQRLLHREGLVLVGFRETKDSAIPRGTVVSSDPPPGKRVAAGTSVVLIVSTGAPPKRVRRPAPQPNVHKMPRPVIARTVPVPALSPVPEVTTPQETPAVQESAPSSARERPRFPRTARSRPSIHPNSAAARPAAPAARVKVSHPGFICDKCGMTFETRAQLSAHEDIHVYRCTICSAGFSSVGDLRRHAREQHFRATLKCPQCSASFYTDTGLRTHMSKHQPGR